MPSIVKYYRDLPNYLVIDEFFTPEEIEKIIDLEELHQFEKGKTGGGSGSKESDHRDSDISWIFPQPQSDWVFQKFSVLTGQVNHSHFMLDIDGFDAFQYTKYKNNQHYNWHYDLQLNYAPWERKISAVILLTSPDKYKGGELEIVVDGNIEKPISIKPKLGSVVFFASWMPHRVAPVKSGIRRSLVAWIMGKRVC